ncbi:alpha/beta hydrolase [Rhodobacter sp. Har01]|uniref:alpha/beta fold hydrolase n=1 Tax=Rhodobacter sp. Har01 TaxID=2883999 RepID=UPI001D06FE47|nr:alpha/beta fold hydrolase [Rhodobacter sp. Har01]MCB6178895.1 alpha/beta hydrolase [Rhodobacter sp. Har01]
MNDPLVLIPGFMADARAFLPQIMHLGSDRAVIVVPPQGDTIEQMSRSALAILPDRFALVGHGLGGEVAIDILRRAGKRVSRIALISTDPLSEPPPVAAAREARLVTARSGRLAEALHEDLPETALVASEWRAEVLAMMQEMGAAMGLETYVRHIRALQRRPDQQKTLRSARVPALILAGAADPLVPVRRQEVLAGLMPFGRLEVIAEAGHLPQLEQPEAVSTALRGFLAGPLMLR